MRFLTSYLSSYNFAILAKLINEIKILRSVEFHDHHHRDHSDDGRRNYRIVWARGIDYSAEGGTSHYVSSRTKNNSEDKVLSKISSSIWT